METKEIFEIGSSKYQGLLEVWKNKENSNLFIQCSEIYTQWDAPEDALKDNSASFPQQDKYSRVLGNSYTNIIPATWEEIKAAGWDTYVLNKPE